MSAEADPVGGEGGAVRYVVINACHGGFSLSEAGVLAYAERKGLTLYPEHSRFGFTTWWTVPKAQRPAELEGEAWHRASMEERQAHNAAYTAGTLSDRDIKRDDPDLLHVVASMGAKANGRCAELRIVAIPADMAWEIEEYDGREWVAETHRTFSDEISPEARAALAKANPRSAS